MPDGLGRMASGRVPRHEACGPCPFRGVESRRRRSAACERIFFSNQKNIPSRFPRKIVRGDFDFPPDNPLETTKGRAAALPLETILEFTGDFRETGAGTSLRAYGGRWDGGRRPGAGCLRSFGAPCLAGDEGDGGSVDLEPALGVHRLSPLRISRLSVGGGLCPAPSGVAGYSDARVGADLCVRPLSRPPQGKAPLCKGRD